MPNNEHNTRTLFADWLRAEMDRRGITITELARRMEAGTGPVSRWVTGSRIPSPAMCVRIADAMALDRDIVLAQAGHRPNVRPSTIVDIARQLEDTKAFYLKQLTILQEDIQSVAGVLVPVIGALPAISPYAFSHYEGIRDVRILEEDLRGAASPVATLCLSDFLSRYGILKGDIVIWERYGPSRAMRAGDFALVRLNGAPFAVLVEQAGELPAFVRIGGEGKREMVETDESDKVEPLGSYVTYKPMSHKHQPSLT